MSNSQLAKLQKFFAQYKEIHYKKRQNIVRPEEKPQGIYYLKKGYVKLYSLSIDGQELNLNIFKPGSYFSMIWALSDLPNKFYFDALTDTIVLRSPKDKIVDFLQQEPELLFDLTRRVMVGLDGLLNRMEFLVFGNAKNKITSILIILAQRFGEKDKNGNLAIKLPLTHQDIANLNGLTRETTSLVMKELERSNLISYQRKTIIIRNLEKIQTESLIYEEEPRLPDTL